MGCMLRATQARSDQPWPRAWVVGGGPRRDTEGSL